jgi:hypothetical protein
MTLFPGPAVLTEKSSLLRQGGVPCVHQLRCSSLIDHPIAMIILLL